MLTAFSGKNGNRSRQNADESLQGMTTARFSGPEPGYELDLPLLEAHDMNGDKVPEVFVVRYEVQQAAAAVISVFDGRSGNFLWKVSS